MEHTKTVVCKLETTEEEFNKLMDTVKAFRSACNYISEVAWNQRCFNPVALHHLTYYETREKFNLPANLAVRARDRVAKSYKNNRKKRHKFTALSMDLDKRLFTLLRNGEFRASISTVYGRVRPGLAIGEYQKELLKNPVRDAKLVCRRDDRHFYLHITVLVEAPEPSGSNPVGVDIGVNNLVAASNGFKVNGKPVESRRRHFRKLRSSLQKKGTSSAKRKLKQLSGRERRWVNTILHQISRAFVDTLSEGDYVVLEKLNGIRDRCNVRKEYRATFHNWAFRRLQEMIEYKCLERGVPVVYVEPKYSSQRCPRCGTIDKRNRKSQALFQCVSCGFQHNADYVASLNLSELARGGWAAVNQPNVGADDRLCETTYKPLPSSWRGS
ncbi:transposase, IS605 OrfB family, central region [Archaeoglobus sulfaticallidus PM70-1]|uniref:Transposase, IS605 OrfB family, central region n=1 Tax=Archaeoglobus sulfaticallidus PM70-1 TaxID=387631 RepID=N0BMB7_9EURY|nr:RNA-guided endonuclease TnpB family protein [Archaeoglobus sulfaticallidus]AGK61415.1 transposase, IS605 OrfB family, central region [Archaeoglobus sulfaticallidus PM70-1]